MYARYILNELWIWVYSSGVFNFRLNFQTTETHLHKFFIFDFIGSMLISLLNVFLVVVIILMLFIN